MHVALTHTSDRIKCRITEYRHGMAFQDQKCQSNILIPSFWCIDYNPFDSRCRVTHTVSMKQYAPAISLWSNCRPLLFILLLFLVIVSWPETMPKIVYNFALSRPFLKCTRCYCWHSYKVSTEHQHRWIKYGFPCAFRHIRYKDSQRNKE